MDEAKETAETKGELSREDVCMTSVKACKTYTRDGPAVVDSQSGARSATHTPAGNARQGNASGGLASVGDLAKSKTKKSKAEHRERICFLIVFDKVGKLTEIGTGPYRRPGG